MVVEHTYVLEVVAGLDVADGFFDGPSFGRQHRVHLEDAGLPPIHGPTGVVGFSVVCCSVSGASSVPERREAVGRLELR